MCMYDNGFINLDRPWTLLPSWILIGDRLTRQSRGRSGHETQPRSSGLSVCHRYSGLQSDRLCRHCPENTGRSETCIVLDFLFSVLKHILVIYINVRE